MLKKVLLVFLITAQILTHGKSVNDKQQGHSLKCHICQSKESWEDCENKQNAVDCPLDFNYVCIKTQITKPVNRPVNRTHDQVTTKDQETIYSKHCDTTEGCAIQECIELGWLCSTKCCNQDLCNSSVSMVTNMLFVINAIFGMLCIHLISE